MLDYDRHVGEMLRRAASQSPDTVFLAERPDSGSTTGEWAYIFGGWRTVTYGEMRRRAPPMRSPQACSIVISTNNPLQ